LAVETDFGKDLPPLRAIPAQIRQVVMNLFHNAAEAIGDRNGSIRVGTRKVTLGPGSVPEGMPQGDYVKLEVSDTGRGMSPEVQARVFDPFFTTKPTGTHGLGLTGVRGIVQHLHGTIRLSSAPGKGTTFQVLLPCAAIAVQTTPGTDATSPDTPGFGPATILVVEDEALLRQAVSKMLRKQGLAVIEAGDGSAALEVIRAETPKDHLDVLLLDITLPGASSRQVYDAAKRLRPGMAVIVTSAKSQELAAASLSAEITCFLRKPFGLAELLDKIQEVLPSRSRANTASRIN